MRTEITTLHVDKEPLSAAEALLVKEAIAGLNKRYKDYPEDKLSQEDLIKRAEYELGVIISMGFADYLLVVSDFLKVGAALGHMPEERLEYLRAHMTEMSMDEMLTYIHEDQSAPGLAVGLGRGSGAGSIICYALEITHLEPTQYNLLFERFLNPERVSMPDVDSDFANAKALYGTRDIVIEYVSKRYGKNAICGITTKQTMAAKKAIDDVARVLCGRDAEGHTSAEIKAMLAEYRGIADAMKKLIPELPGVGFDDEVAEGGSTVAEVISYQFIGNTKALEILEYARQLEGVNDNYGKHAAGVVIADNGDIGEYGALMYDEEIGWKIQMDGPDVEGIGGLLKMDFLGLTTLNIITATLRLIFEHYGIYVDPFAIPQEKEIYEKIFSTGNTFGVFQFAGAGVQQILRRFQPDSLEDLIIINAINRPGPAQYIDPIIKKKHGEHVDVTAFDKVDCLNDLLAPTYGYPVYQEQVMQIFQKMGQYSLGGADEIRRAMSKKKQYIIDENREIFVHGGNMENHDTHKVTPVAGAESIGIPAQLAYDVFDSVQDFAKYGFNKSHAAVYAVTAYMTAWLKYHYPVEFFTSYLNIANDPLEDILADAKKNGVKILAPDINKSESIFTCDKDQIYFGYNGFGLQASMNDPNRDYVSMPDFILRTTLTKATVEKMVVAGAFDRFSSSRRALLQMVPIYMDYKDDLKKAQKTFDDYTRLKTDLASGIKVTKDQFSKYGLTRKTLPKPAEIDNKISESQKQINELTAIIKAQIIPVKQYPDDPLQKLKDEKAVLKAYISGHPLELYGKPESHNCTAVADIITEGYYNVLGIVTDLKVRSKKTDPSAKMAFFTLEDISGGKIPVCVFDKAFEKYHSMFVNYEGKPIEDNILQLKGSVKPDRRRNDGTLQFIVSDRDKEAVAKPNNMPDILYFDIEGIEKLAELHAKLKPYQSAYGHPVRIHDLTTGDIMTLDYKVSAAVKSL